MDLEKGDENNLTGKLWLYSEKHSKAFYFTDKQESFVSEIGSILGMQSALNIVKAVKNRYMGKDDITGFIPVFETELPLDEDHKLNILASGCDVINLDTAGNQNRSALDLKVKSEFNHYFKLYVSQAGNSPAERQDKKTEDEPYRTEKFMNAYFIPFRTALELDYGESVLAPAKANLLLYSEGKKFRQDAEKIVGISANNSLAKDKKLEGIGLYGMLIDYYMKEEYEKAAQTQKQIAEWRKNNNLDV
jgi:hypothetical protein